MFPLVGDRVGAGDRYFEDNTASNDSTGTRWLRPDGDRLDHSHGNVVTGHAASEAAHLNRVIAGVCVLHVCEVQRGFGGAANQISVTPPLVGQFRIRKGAAGRDLQCRGAVQQSVRALGHRVDHRCLRQFMVQLYRARLTSDSVHGNEVSDAFLHIEDHLTVLAIPTAIVVTANLLERIPSAARAHLVYGQHRIEITVFRGQLGGAFLRGGEGCPRRGATGVAGVVRLARILGSASGGVDRRAAKREFARLFLYVAQLGD